MTENPQCPRVMPLLSTSLTIEKSLDEVDCLLESGDDLNPFLALTSVGWSGRVLMEV